LASKKMLPVVAVGTIGSRFVAASARGVVSGCDSAGGRRLISTAGVAVLADPSGCEGHIESSAQVALGPASRPACGLSSDLGGRHVQLGGGQRAWRFMPGTDLPPDAGLSARVLQDSAASETALLSASSVSGATHEPTTVWS
jgi:hypothetical protein